MSEGDIVRCKTCGTIVQKGVDCCGYCNRKILHKRYKLLKQKLLAFTVVKSRK